MSKLTRAMQVIAADKKLTKNSPPEAHFHRGMREYHKDQARENGKWGLNDPKKAAMHKKYADHHNTLYKKAMK